jgi:hypothetical protein
MTKKNNRFGLNKLKVVDDNRFERSRNIREERKVKEDLPKMLFSFKDFDRKQLDIGQTYEIWEENKLLSYMVEKFGYICQLNRIEAEQQGYITVYYDFPIKSDFKNPFPDVKLDWAVVTKIGGQKSRVAGHIIDNIFYVVFLDKEHRFFIAEKKHT